MEKRTLLAVVLSSAVFILYYSFFYKPPVPPQPAANVVAGTPATGGPESRTSPTGSALPAKPAGPEVFNPLGNGLLESKISSLTGLPVEWLLKKYFVQANNKGPNVDLLQAVSGTAPLGLLLIPGQEVVFPQFQVKEGGGQALQYEGRIGELGVQEKVELGSTDYTLQVSLHLENHSANPQSVAPGLRLQIEQNLVPPRGFLMFKEAPNLRFPLYRIGTKVTRQRNVQKLGPYQEEVGELSWVGLEDRYFLRMLLARNVSPQNRVAYGSVGNGVFSQLQYATEALAPGQQRDYAFTLYLGPKDPGLLKQFGEAQLDKAVDYGWFGFIALPILTLLKLFYSVLHNWGLAIIALTLLIKLILHPLSRKSMASMKAMQTLQPQLQKLREKYADDREQLNLQTMDLFRRHKVNPMGGCLPMVIQMPIYIALYKVLYNATDLYHAPFFGFYHDLSAPDPYYILPILLGVFMVLQQKMTPNPSADPAQAKMMMIMPVMFSLFMLFLPLGLVLYIFFNTVLTVLQQYMNKNDISFSDLFRGRKETA